jgi:hypothetical protein
MSLQKRTRASMCVAAGSAAIAIGCATLRAKPTGKHPLDGILPVGPRSYLFGAHQFIIHPIAVAIAWRKIYGSWPTAIPYYAAFLLHDIGYLLDWCPNMDGPEGRLHPERGGDIMAALFDPAIQDAFDDGVAISWAEFTWAHSRSYQARYHLDNSRLMPADKYATGMLPVWLLGLLYWSSGEYVEFRDRWLRHTDPPYPGRPDDGAWAFARHIKDEWRRFARPGADPGTPFS